MIKNTLKIGAKTIAICIVLMTMTNCREKKQKDDPVKTNIEASDEGAVQGGGLKDGDKGNGLEEDSSGVGNGMDSGGMGNGVNSGGAGNGLDDDGKEGGNGLDSTGGGNG